MTETIELTITDLTVEGNGVARTEEGQVVMVEGVLPGDVAEVAVRQSPKSVRILEGKVSRFITKSPERIDHPCQHHYPLSSGCAGCRGSLLGTMEYQAQLRWKRDNLIQTLRRIGGITAPEVADVISSPQQWGYRDRIELSLEIVDGRLQFSYGRQDERVSISDCLLASATIQAALSELAASRIDIDSQHLGRILLRDNGQGKCVVVLFNAGKPSEKLLDELSAKFTAASIAGFEIAGVEDMTTRFHDFRLLRAQGEDTIKLDFSGDTIALPPQVFTQANIFNRDNLLNTVIKSIPNKSNLLDLYGGFGWFGLAHAMRGGRATVVEASQVAVSAGQKFADQKGLKVDFFRTDLNRHFNESIIKDMDAVVVDPPRAGLSKPLRKTLNASRARRVVYVSCHPAALARDLQALTNYRPALFTPVDMFPQTPDLETVVLLEPR